jgi:hypothetical protein
MAFMLHENWAVRTELLKMRDVAILYLYTVCNERIALISPVPPVLRTTFYARQDVGIDRGLRTAGQIGLHVEFYRLGVHEASRALGRVERFSFSIDRVKFFV